MGYVVGYQYNGEGNRTGLVYPSGSEVAAVYDDLNRIDQLRDGEGRLLADYSYDSMRRTSAAVFSFGTKVSIASYTYDGNQLYEYDWENRLTAGRRKSDYALTAEYRYDPTGIWAVRQETQGGFSPRIHREHRELGILLWGPRRQGN